MPQTWLDQAYTWKFIYLGIAYKNVFFFIYYVLSSVNRIILEEYYFWEQKGMESREENDREM